MTTTNRVYLTTGGYESRCSRPNAERWLRDREYLAARPNPYYTVDIEHDRAYAVLVLRCADGVEQCAYDARRQAVRAVQAVMAAVPAGPCTYCGLLVAATVDHVTARARGGAHAPGNLVRACAKCNSSKGKTPLRVWLRSTAPQARLARAHLREMSGQTAMPLFPVGKRDAALLYPGIGEAA